MTPFDLSVRFFLQMAFILTVCRLVGWVFRRLGQSQVVSEMIAGVLMGPSFFGWLAPAASAYVFPPASKPIIFAVSQIGLSLYMFLVGAEFDVSLLRERVRSAASISAAGVLAPFLLGGLLALKIADDPTLFGANVSPTLVILFMGASMSITAFPMLARMIYEQGLTRTSLGTLTLAAGSMDDAAAWCVLAIVLGTFAGSSSFAAIAIGGVIALRVTLARQPRGAQRAAHPFRKDEAAGGTNTGVTAIFGATLIAAFGTLEHLGFRARECHADDNKDARRPSAYGRHKSHAMQD